MDLPLGNLGNFSPDEILAPSFAAGLDLDEESLPPIARRERPITFPPDTAIAGIAAFDPLSSFEREADPLFRLHPYQFGSSREEALQYIAEYRTFLIQLTGFTVVGSPAARRTEILDQLTELFEGRIVRILTPVEKEFDRAPAIILGDDGQIEDLNALGVRNIVLISPAVLETLGEAKITALLREIRKTDAVVGVSIADLRPFAVGFSPAHLRFDFTVIDLSPFLPEGGEWYIPLFTEEIVPSERTHRIDAIHSLPFLDTIVRIDTQLRHLGASGLRYLAEAAAIRSAYLRYLIRRHTPELCLGGTLLDTYVRGIPPIRISSTETKSELEGLAAQISICQ